VQGHLETGIRLGEPRWAVRWRDQVNIFVPKPLMSVVVEFDLLKHGPLRQFQLKSEDAFPKYAALPFQFPAVGRKRYMSSHIH